MIVEDLGTMDYEAAWRHQEQVHAEVAQGGAERLLLVEHPPVITLGRRVGVIRHLIASEEDLGRIGVALVQSDRGGDITFHGPGQLVAYPILRLIDHHLSVGGYVRMLQECVIALLKEFDLEARLDAEAVGVWAPNAKGELAKICAIGVRIRRGVTMHGLALNVTTDLDYFNLIVPCGLSGRPVTSMQTLMAERTPSMQVVKQRLEVALRELLESGFSPCPACHDATR
jgi:lipoyl(octanoyl) transferase